MTSPQAPPAQALMQDSARNAEASDGRGASLQNSQTRWVGECYGTLCLCCAACGCANNLVTISQGCVGVVTEFGRYTRTLPPGRHTFNVMSETVTPINMR